MDEEIQELISDAEIVLAYLGDKRKWTAKKLSRLIFWTRGCWARYNRNPTPEHREDLEEIVNNLSNFMIELEAHYRITSYESIKLRGKTL